MTDCTAPSPIVSEMREHLARTAKGYDGTSIKGMIAFVAKKLGLEAGRVRHYWYGDVRRVEAQEADLIRNRAWIAEQERLARQRREYEAARRAFIETAPGALARLAPPSLADLEEQATADEIAPRRAGGAR